LQQNIPSLEILDKLVMSCLAEIFSLSKTLR
jgi:hypothetical protein